MSIECTTSANNTVTCLYSAGGVTAATAAPHSLQNFAFGGSSVPHDPHTKAAAVMSGGQPAAVHVTIVSPPASQHVPYRRCDPATGRALDRASGRGVSVGFRRCVRWECVRVRFCWGVRCCGGCSFGGGDVVVHRCGIVAHKRLQQAK